MKSEYNNLKDFLIKHKTKDKTKITHTRIGNESANIFGGCYNITGESKKIFNKLYYNEVIKNNKLEYLTEKQKENGVIAIDFDFRYSSDVDERLHTEDEVKAIIDLYITKLDTLIHLNKIFNIFVFEKPNVNEVGDVTKDGIHIIIGISLDDRLKVMLRNLVLEEIENEVSELSDKLDNEWSSIIDEGVCIGKTNWQLYGSRKPNHEAYKLSYHYNCSYDNNINEWEYEDVDVLKFDYANKLNELSVQHEYDSCMIREEVEKDLKNKQTKKPKLLKFKNGNEIINYSEIDSEEKLDKAIDKLLDMAEANVNEYKLKEIHDYTMILPEKYYGPGSYDKWIRVGWALRNTNYKLYITWLKLSSKSKSFKWSDASELWRRWNEFNPTNDDGLTDKSIYFWARQDATEEYEKRKKHHIKFYIDATIETKSDYDKANVLYQWYKDRFICVSIKTNSWYEYREQRWFEIDSGITLRNLISTDVFELYFLEIKEMSNKMHGVDPDGPEYAKLFARNKSLVEIAHTLKKTDKKNNIMREARDLFYVKDFMNLLDSKNNLLCFNNGVIDFNEKIFRKGIPEDYTSKCTNIDYIPLDDNKHKENIDEINLFMYQLFPNDELRKYMWEHLASVLIGKNDNQTFNIYTGRGRNGKSKLVELMSLILGDYKATVPITLITQKRNSIGSTSSEIVQLMGVRYAVMQEPSVGDSINEGIMKEITGGDPIQGRALFKDSVTFVPQFKLVVCTNHLFDIKSNDDGTWRRIRVCDFVSLFTENPVDGEEDKPYQFKVDKYIDRKFEQWKCVFMSMLVEKAMETQGEVKDCDIVCAKSQLYRETQDHFAEFVRDNVKIQAEGVILTQKELKDNFNEWWKLNYGGSPPNGKGLFDFMNKKFGKFVKGEGWKGVSLDDDEFEPDPMGP